MSFAPSRYRFRTAAILTATAIASAQAQQTSTLHGTVRDPLGALVPNAQVELLDAGHVVASTTTSPVGEYSFPVTATGRYSVRVAARTFQPTTTRAEYLKASEPTELNVTLATATLTQQVTVTATGTPTPEAQTGAALTVLPASSYHTNLRCRTRSGSYPAHR